MLRDTIIPRLKNITGHLYLELVLRGNSAITSALSAISLGKSVLIPEEGGWLSYRTAPKKEGLSVVEVACQDAGIDVVDLRQKLSSGKIGALLYQNPGGYFAEQPMKEMYGLCQEFGCLVIMDVSGSIGTSLCDGQYADILVGSFGEWKLVEAKGGGFISSRDPQVWERLVPHLEKLHDEVVLKRIGQSLEKLDERIIFLQKKVAQIKKDLKHLNLVHPSTTGFVVVIKFNSAEEKEEIRGYCQERHLEWTECPRYIRLNKKAISIEVKRLES